MDTDAKSIVATELDDRLAVLEELVSSSLRLNRLLFMYIVDPKDKTWEEVSHAIDKYMESVEAEATKLALKNLSQSIKSRSEMNKDKPCEEVKRLN